MSKVTVVSETPIDVSVASAVEPRYRVAVPPVSRPATIVACAVKFVFVLLSVFATTVPPTGVSVNAVGLSNVEYVVGELVR